MCDRQSSEIQKIKVHNIWLENELIGNSENQSPQYMIGKLTYFLWLFVKMHFRGLI